MKLFLNITNFFKKIFSGRKEKYLPTANETIENETTSNVEPSNNVTKNDGISEKNIVLFLYKQLRIGNLEPKYIPDKYIDKIKTLLEAEKQIRTKQLSEMKKNLKNY